MMVVEVTEPSKFSTSTKRTKKTRATKIRKEYTKRTTTESSSRQRSTRSRTTRVFTGPFAMYRPGYRRTSSVAPIIISYPTKPETLADPVAEPHPLNINLSVYLYPQKEGETSHEIVYQNGEDVIEKPEVTKKKPVLIATETIPVLPPGFEPVVDVTGSNHNKKKV